MATPCLILLHDLRIVNTRCVTHRCSDFMVMEKKNAYYRFHGVHGNTDYTQPHTLSLFVKINHTAVLTKPTQFGTLKIVGTAALRGRLSPKRVVETP